MKNLSRSCFQFSITCLIFFCLCSVRVKAQYFEMEKYRKRVTVPFNLIRDLIIIQLKINDRGPFNFILDTGAGLMLITDPALVDSIEIKSKRSMKISGLGEGLDYEAYFTPALKIDIPGLVSNNVGAAILKTDHFGLSNYAGMPIHGLLGYDFFSNLAVKIDFSDSTMTVSKPQDLRYFRRGQKIPLKIEDRKPYLNADITFPNGVKTSNKLVVDIGAGHPLSIENMIEKHGLPEKFIAANLGVGLTGPINGFLSRVTELDLGKYKLKNVITSFPQNNRATNSFSVPRDGNLGLGTLKRFTMIIDYPDSALYIKPGPLYDLPFDHDMSGLEYYRTGDDLDRVLISRVEPGSSADEVGILKDDELLTINFKLIKKMTMEQIDAMFKSENERALLLEINRNKKTLRFIITLKKRI